jgi:hypothetical protein
MSIRTARTRSATRTRANGCLTSTHLHKFHDSGVNFSSTSPAFVKAAAQTCTQRSLATTFAHKFERILTQNREVAR